MPAIASESRNCDRTPAVRFAAGSRQEVRFHGMRLNQSRVYFLDEGTELRPNTEVDGSAFGDGEMTELGWALGRKLARTSNRPTGLAAVNDMFAIGVIAGLRERGLSVPADVSVVGSDDLFLAPRLNPPLTSVRLPFAEMARCMVERLVARISDPGIPAHEFLFQPTLVSRQSVARPPSTTQKRPAATRMRAP